MRARLLACAARKGQRPFCAVAALSCAQKLAQSAEAATAQAHYVPPARPTRVGRNARASIARSSARCPRLGRAPSLAQQRCEKHRDSKSAAAAGSAQSVAMQARNVSLVRAGTAEGAGRQRRHTPAGWADRLKFSHRIRHWPGLKFDRKTLGRRSGR